MLEPLRIPPLRRLASPLIGAACAAAVALLSPTAAAAQDPPGETTSRAETDARVEGRQASEAFRASEASDPPGWARDAALFVGLVGFDATIRGAMSELRRSGAVEGPAGLAEHVGDWQATLPYFAAGSAVIGGLTEGTTGLGKTVAMLGGVLAGSMANEILNQAVGRDRPLEGNGPFSFDPFDGHASFPSGHAAFAFSMAGSLDAATDHWLPAAAGYALASACAASRVHDGKHWVSDAVVGSVIGAVVSRWSTRRLMGALGVRDPGDEEPPGDDAPVGDGSASLLDRIHPVATPSFVGVSIRL